MGVGSLAWGVAEFRPHATSQRIRGSYESLLSYLGRRFEIHLDGRHSYGTGNLQAST